MLLSDEKAIRALKMLSPINMRDVHSSMTLNLSVLSGPGVPQSFITALLTICPDVMCQNVDKFSEDVKRVLKMGFDPLKFTFAVHFE